MFQLKIVLNHLYFTHLHLLTIRLQSFIFYCENIKRPAIFKNKIDFQNLLKNLFDT